MSREPADRNVCATSLAAPRRMESCGRFMPSLSFNRRGQRRGGLTEFRRRRGALQRPELLQLARKPLRVEGEHEQQHDARASQVGLLLVVFSHDKNVEHVSELALLDGFPGELVQKEINQV